MTKITQDNFKFISPIDFLNKLIETSQHIIVLSEISGKIVFVSEQIEKLLGIKVPEILETNVLDWISPQDRDIAIINFNNILNQNFDINNYTLIKKDKSTVHVKIVSSRIDNYVLSIVTDITEVSKQERLIKETIQDYRILIKETPLGFIMIDTQGNILDANNSLLEILGSPSLEATMAINFFKYPPLIKSGVSDDLKNCINTGQKVIGEHFYVTKWNKRVYLKYYLIPIKENGKVTKVQGLVEDLTKQKEYEQQLIESKIFLDRVINNLYDAVFVKNSQHKYVLVNNSTAKYLAIPKEELISKTTYDFLPKEKADKYIEQDKKVLETGEESIIEDTVTTKTGTYHLVMKKTLYQDTFGEKFVITLVSDITKEKELEKQLKNKIQELEEKNKELEEFAYIISHDLKSPLNLLFYFLDSISEDLQQNKIENIKQTIDKSKDTVIKMNNIINGILEYSKVNNKVVKEKVEVKKLLLEIKNLSQFNPNFTINIHDPMPILLIEKIKLQQIFSNLINNAIKHHHKDKGNIDIYYQEESNWHQFIVQDDGPGIPKELYNKIFEIFYTKDSNSTGIGLAIVKKLITNLGGSIKVESEVNKGSKFIFTLPK